MANVFSSTITNSNPISSSRYGFSTGVAGSSSSVDIFISGTPTLLICQYVPTSITLRMTGNQTSSPQWSSIKIGNITKTRTSATSAAYSSSNNYTTYTWSSQYQNPFSTSAGGTTDVTIEGTLAGGVGVLINNSSGNSMVDTRTDKQTTVIISGTVSCPATTTSVVSGTYYASAIGSGSYTNFGAPNNSIDTIWQATSSGTLTSGRVAALQILTATGITTSTLASSGILVYNADPSNAAKLYNTFLPDGSVLANNKIAIANYVASARDIDYAAVRF